MREKNIILQTAETFIKSLFCPPPVETFTVIILEGSLVKATAVCNGFWLNPTHLVQK